MKKIVSVIFLLTIMGFGLSLKAQSKTYSRQDSLRGTLSSIRSCYDVTFYDLSLRVDPEEKFISGSNTMHYKVVADFDKIQVDLFKNMKIERIMFENKEVKFEREGNATYIFFPRVQKKGDQGQIYIAYSGYPRIARFPPWDGGFSWKLDKNNNHFIGVSCEGIGASLWWPNKDHLSEEPDSMRISCAVPSDLVCVANGNLRKKTQLASNYTRYDWFVSYPINNYNVSLNIAKYAQFSDTYQSEDGETLALDYYVLEYNVDKAKKQFEQVKPMLACYEKLFGKYPFWNDGFALVETSYLGMEHQGAVAYGNKYRNGYLGSDLSGTGIGMKFDYIIIHEVGHEYWGNSVSCKDHAELWIHEAFCTYTEGLYVECLFGLEEAAEYIAGQSKRISNTEPIIAPLGVNASGSGDMYFKGANLLHTLRNVIDNDDLWFAIIKGIATDFKIQNISTRELIEYVNQKAGQDFTYFFQQYLYHKLPPTLVYKIEEENGQSVLAYKWKADIDNFSMPIQIQTNNKTLKMLKPTPQWQKINVELPDNQLKLKKNAYYILLDKLG